MNARMKISTDWSIFRIVLVLALDLLVPGTIFFIKKIKIILDKYFDLFFSVGVAVLLLFATHWRRVQSILMN